MGEPLDKTFAIPGFIHSIARLTATLAVTASSWYNATEIRDDQERRLEGLLRSIKNLNEEFTSLDQTQLAENQRADLMQTLASLAESGRAVERRLEQLKTVTRARAPFEVDFLEQDLDKLSKEVLLVTANLQVLLLGKVRVIRSVSRRSGTRNPDLSVLDIIRCASRLQLLEANQDICPPDFVSPENVGSVMEEEIREYFSWPSDDIGWSKSYLWQWRPFPIASGPKTRRETIAHIDALARQLNTVEPVTHTGMLKCRGYITERRAQTGETAQSEGAFMLFELPSPNVVSPKTLRDLLLSPENTVLCHPLNDRLKLAWSITVALAFMHKYDCVHKGINPDHIVILDPKEGGYPQSLGEAVLMGLHDTRFADQDSSKRADSRIERKIYRHPDRQGPQPLAVKSTMLDDIYSLGVVLLEIGTWKSLLVRKKNTGGHLQPLEPGSSIFYAVNGKGKGKAKSAEQARMAASPPSLASAEDIKTGLLKKASESLPAHMGHQYARIVQNCLRCHESGWGDKADFQDSNADRGIAFNERILRAFSEIRI